MRKACWQLSSQRHVLCCQRGSEDLWEASVRQSESSQHTAHTRQSLRHRNSSTLSWHLDHQRSWKNHRLLVRRTDHHFIHSQESVFCLCTLLRYKWIVQCVSQMHVVCYSMHSEVFYILSVFILRERQANVIWVESKSGKSAWVTEQVREKMWMLKFISFVNEQKFSFPPRGFRKLFLEQDCRFTPQSLRTFLRRDHLGKIPRSVKKRVG